MKRIIYLLIAVILLPLTGCKEDIDIVIPEEYEVAAITGIAVYREAVEGDAEYAKKETLVSVKSTATINTEAVVDGETIKLVKVTLAATADLTKLKVTLTISPGATVVNPLGTNIQDFSETRTIDIVSPSGKVTNKWYIQILNP
jgi:hypothetical protein